jgi:hypothetical protein
VGARRAAREADVEGQRTRAQQHDNGGRIAAADGVALSGEQEAVEDRVGGEDSAPRAPAAAVERRRGRARSNG